MKKSKVGCDMQNESDLLTITVPESNNRNSSEVISLVLEGSLVKGNNDSYESILYDVG